jgi:hypothetical protein
VGRKAGKPAEGSLPESIRRRFASLGGVDLKIPLRDTTGRDRLNSMGRNTTTR